MAGQTQAQNVDLFDAYFRRADLDKDGRISGPEAVAFFQGSNLPNQVLAQIWTHADHNKTGFLGRNEFYNALKLVTVAQSKRELIPDIVKAALYGPASTKIPAPRINFAATPAPPSNPPVGALMPQLHGAASPAPLNVGLGGPQVTPNASMGQQFFSSQQTQSAKPPRPMPSATGFRPQQGTIAPSHPPSSNNSADWLGGSAGVPSALVASQISNRGIAPPSNQVGFGMAMPGAISGAQPRPQATAVLAQPGVTKRDDPSLPPSQEGAKDSKALVASGNGFVPGSVFGDAFSTSSSQPKQDSAVPASSAGGLAVSSTNTPVSTGSQSTIKPGAFGSLHDSFTQQSPGSQHQQVQTAAKGSQKVPLPSSTAITSASSGFLVGAGNSNAGQFQVPWPKITQTEVQKYTKVFVAVDTDRDGKITGEQARNLFLSWRLPREVLKQVWDLSDQDNDSMLSLREFCVALYLMERYREGRTLPTTLPSGVLLDEGLLPATGQFAATHGNASWRPSPGLQQPQMMPAAQPATHADRARQPNQVPRPLAVESVPPSPQKSKVPVLEKNLVDQLSEQEQNSLNAKFQEATEANKKVEELEKEIVESRQKIEFYRSKMQELILYKSRCDSRLNEISERVSADKREVESLAKKYEEKYKQRGDVASKLTIEESTFRDIQEKKMELYRAIVKMEQDGKPDTIQVHADRIKLELEELVKSLNERCKTYGLRAKPITVVELPFGWQPGIQGGAADWDENWDKFTDEGFTFVKELTLDVQNIVAPPKEKSLVRNKTSSLEGGTEVSSSTSDGKSEKLPSSGEKVPNDAQSEDGTAASPTGSPLGRNASESPSKKSQSSPYIKTSNADASSPHDTETQSEHGSADSVLHGDKSFDEPSWGTFDTHYDTDSVWDFNSGPNKDMEHSFFDSGDLGLPPIRTDLLYRDNMPKKSTFVFTDSVPGTPLYGSGSSPQADSMFQKKSTFVFDSVPSTPQSDVFKKSTFTFDSMPSTPQADNLFEKKSTFQFDSVPSTPMYNNSNSPRGFGEGLEGHSFDSFSRFDSFNVHDSGGFQARDSFTRFDSFHSTADSEYGQGFFSQQDSLARFDSFRSTRESDDGHGFFPQRNYARFDSIQSTRDSDDSHGFPSFDDTDPFGSGPFKTSLDGQTPRRDADSWKPF